MPSGQGIYIDGRPALKQYDNDIKRLLSIRCGAPLQGVRLFEINIQYRFHLRIRKTFGGFDPVVHPQ